MGSHKETRRHVPVVWKEHVAPVLSKLASLPWFLEPDVVHIYPKLDEENKWLNLIIHMFRIRTQAANYNVLLWQVSDQMFSDLRAVNMSVYKLCVYVCVCVCACVCVCSSACICALDSPLFPKRGTSSLTMRGKLLTINSQDMCSPT